MEVISSCGLSVFLETSPARRHAVWESVTAPGHWIGTLLEGDLSVKQARFGERRWRDGGATMFSCREPTPTHHMAMKDGRISAVFIQLDADAAEPVIGGEALSFITRSGPEPMQVLPELARTIAWQMLGCRMTGAGRRLYMTGKALEMIAHVVSAADTQGNGHQNAALSTRDIARLHEARDILLAELSHPPSVPELARRVGTNAKKLGSGFQELFGTTVYGFVKQNRLDVARILLEGGETSISHVARQVGYQPQHFATEFRRRFGLSPTQLAGGRR
ncbi:helix-turn-helix transcriptional regulator [Pseudochelatococcus contaminans]|uniref:helix-turn-helix transcriptional regulator n=1 Tax=Pseudochelatococcus contaminans TaxID=1538103 RepID=UPI001609B9D2|nr:AraC family transcriptional regulator [Pseudochelatococcus contaminans]